MLNIFKKKQPVAEPGAIREVLFGDMPMEKWPAQRASEEPWASFVAARKNIASGRAEEAVNGWRRILAMPDLESRHYMQAWHFLRSQGVQPEEAEAKRVYGVIVEVALPAGVDIVAAYADGHARYLNHSGSGVVWDKPDNSLASQIQALLQAGQNTANQIGPWLQARPSAPQRDELRINMLTPSGLHFGQGPINVLSADPLAKPVFDAATQLMLALVAKTENSKP